MADEAGLRAAVLNLTMNAVEAAGPGGEVNLGASAGHGEVTIEVSDNGPGRRRRWPKPCSSRSSRASPKASGWAWRSPAGRRRARRAAFLGTRRRRDPLSP